MQQWRRLRQSQPRKPSRRMRCAIRRVCMKLPPLRELRIRCFFVASCRNCFRHRRLPTHIFECSLGSGSRVEIAECVAKTEATVNDTVRLSLQFIIIAAKELDETTGRRAAVPAPEKDAGGLVILSRRPLRLCGFDFRRRVRHGHSHPVLPYRTRPRTGGPAPPLREIASVVGRA